MADDIVTRLSERCAGGGETRRLMSQAVDEIERLRAEINSMASAQAGWGRVARLEAEIERLRALCNDLYHDATCAEAFCRLCGEGIKAWQEARRG